MLTLNELSFDFGGRYLYKDVNWQIKPGERIGLVGQNGTGKSTLLRIITNEYQPTEGSLSKSKDCTIGFLNQDLLSYESDESIYTVALQAFEKALILQKEIDAIIERLEFDHSDEILNLLGDKQEEFEALDGYNIQFKTEEILEGLGFKTADLQRPLKEFSGGWRMRVMLAKLLLQNPRLLLLDEPTNHLDLPSIEWIEEYLQSFEGCVIVVSHDRLFLDKMVNKIVEVANKKVYQYTGNYSKFLELKAERDDLQSRAFENQQQFIKQQEKLIDRFKAKASKATMAQSRMKMLEKIDRIEEVQNDESVMNLRFKVRQQPGKVLVSLKNVSKRYDDQIIFENASAQILRGDKIALIGANGKGKSTLLRIIDKSESFEGEVENGHNLEKTFYAQHQLESLNIQNEILEELSGMGSSKLESELRSILGSFLFSGDDVYKKIKVLSGGEKARVALAKTLVEEANFLLLDEPTNHLDIQSMNILIQALQTFEGTFITVSHDRYFISQIANKIWWIEEDIIKEYEGPYDEWKYWMSQREKNKPVIESKNANKTQNVSKPIESISDTKVLDKQKKQLQIQLDEIEIELNTLKYTKTEIEKQIEDSANTHKIGTLSEQYQQNENLLISKNKTFETIFEQLMSLE
ncbi:MAG: ABC-F family ATP-binding cassette domain-containing protein [Bacteroidetes bacterium]|nr:ABC-F family ATP-binding cassette domain-containing protein [Bacteroidota bacterium]